MYGRSRQNQVCRRVPHGPGVSGGVPLRQDDGGLLVARTQGDSAGYPAVHDGAVAQRQRAEPHPVGRPVRPAAQPGQAGSAPQSDLRRRTERVRRCHQDPGAVHQREQDPRGAQQDVSRTAPAQDTIVVRQSDHLRHARIV
uniref:(northern house mosquito) hypothetical protein n=1 Tax=Culex pipiens TaxID=7175 RepID=A0A8D8ALI5_CULPI